ncbi:MAG: hypothetical protein JSV86_18450 [Gemmatimonadota bacterium]|nr:MAG: hypothetical protein JSV86_18450 [Gemmatimonadota bacterium]
MRTMVSSVAFRWDRPANVLWACVRTRNGQRYEVGFPVGQVRFYLDREMRRVGLELPPTVEGCETVDGLFGDIAKAVGRTAKAVTKPVTRTVRRATRTVTRATRGVRKAFRRTTRKLGRLAKRAVRKYGRTALRLARTGAAFVPGVGTGIAAGLGAAEALARGQGWRQALQAGALSAIPGGPLARAAARTGVGLLEGKRLDRAALAAASGAIPGGALGREAFKTGLALARGERLDRAALAAAQRQVPGGAAGRQAMMMGLSIARGHRIDRVAQRGLVRALPAVSGEGLAALATARRAHRMFRGARRAADRIRAGHAMAGDLGRMQGISRMRSRVATLARSRNPRARMLDRAFRSIW